MRSMRGLAAGLGGFALAGASLLADERVPLGFDESSVRAERELESRFDGLLDARNLKTWMLRLAAEPHHVGSRWGRENAEFMAGLLRSWGYDTRIESYDVMLPTPLERRVEMLDPSRYLASLDEPVLPQDRTSGQKKDQLPTYNAYSLDGDVEGELVYVNYGVPADYEELALRGVDVKGKIVIARYGGSWRGIKPKVAAEHGALGCIIYSDPIEDGYAQGDPYPKGGWRSEQSVQRGSVKDMPIYSGDVLTPGRAATKDAKRLSLAEAETLTRIPVLPISAADARPLLSALTGPMAPPSWRGALPLPYRLGPGPARVRLKARFDWKLVPAHDVIAVMRGSEWPDEWVIRGNHHDAWVNGANDPVSGMVALLEEARAVGELARAGFRPRRSLVYAAWDGEEQGLLGSTEWVEDHLAELRQKAVAYINSDGNERGFLSVGGSHSLESFVNAALGDVQDPIKHVPVLARARARAILDASPEESKAARAQAGLALQPLGSGSDFTPFLQHAGIASLNVGYGEEGAYGQYHSIYDSIDHYTRFMDPDFAYGVTLARTAGRLTLRLAQAEVLPLDFGPAVAVIEKYASEVEALADRLRDETEQRNKDIDAGLFEAWFTPHETRVTPPRREAVPFLNFAPLRNALHGLRRARESYDAARTARGTRPLPAARLQELNAVLRGAEQALTRDQGLPGRPWYRHQIYAPGRYTGYGVKTLPAVREALELRRFAEASEQIAVVAGTLEAFGQTLERAARLWQEP